MSDRQAANKAMKAANLKTIERVRDFIQQLDDKLITSKECYQKIRDTIQADIDIDKDAFEAELLGK